MTSHTEADNQKLKARDPVLASYMNGTLKGLVHVCMVSRVIRKDIDITAQRDDDGGDDAELVLLVGQVTPSENGVYAINDGRLVRQHLIMHWRGAYVTSTIKGERYVCLSPQDNDVDDRSPLLFVKW